MSLHVGHVALACAALVLAACNFAPTYERPAPAIASSWPAGEAYPAAGASIRGEAVPSISYRDIFRDPALQALIERAVDNNQNLRVALANVASARGLLRVQRAQQLPRIDGSGGVTVGESSRAQSSGPAVAGRSGSNTAYDLSIGLTSFEIDLFGRLRNLSEASLREYLATEAAARAVRLTLIAEVANAYLIHATDRSLLVIARETEITAVRSVELTRLRLEGGVAPRTDLRQAETVLAQARSDFAELTTQVAQDRNALELLVGGPVDEATLAASIESIDALLEELPAGLDSAILLGRPDVVQAEYLLQASNARIGAARAAFFPRISLTAVAGLASGALSTLFTGDAFAWSVQPAVSLPIFDGGANRGNLQFTLADRDAALAQYQRTIQTAFREVADALARRGTIGSQYEAQLQLVEAARDSYELADARYREGIDRFLISLDAQRTLYNARRSLASTRLVRAGNLVELYRALGGEGELAGDAR